MDLMHLNTVTSLSITNINVNALLKKLKKSIKSNRVMFYGDIAKEEWVAMFETFRDVMFDFFEYNEFHTRLGYTFHECIDLFSRISTLLIDEQNGQK